MKKIISILLVGLVLLLPFGALAQEQTWEFTQEGDKIEFIINGNTRSYERYTLQKDEVVIPESVEIYEIEDGEYVEIPSNTSNYLFRQTAFNEVYFPNIYASAQGKEELLELREGKYYFYAVARYDNYYFNSDIDNWILNDIKSIDTQPYLINATDFADMEKETYELLGFEKNRSVAKRIGAIYILNSGVYYLDLQDSNQCRIDEDGRIYYTADKIALTEITGELKNTVKLYIDSSKNHHDANYHFSDDHFSSDFDDEDGAKIVFYITSIIFSIIAPGILLVLGIVFAQSKKSLHPKKWYALSLTSALWIAVNVVLMCIVALQ